MAPKAKAKKLEAPLPVDLPPVPVAADEQPAERIEQSQQHQPRQKAPAPPPARGYLAERELYAAVEADSPAHLLTVIEKATRGAGVDLNWANPENDNKTASHVAAERGFEACLSLLLSKGAHTHLRDRNGNSALHLALQHKHPRCATLLAEKTILSLEQTQKELSEFNLGTGVEEKSKRHSGPPTFESMLASVRHRVRSSTLTELLKIVHFRTIHNQWFATLVVGFLSISAQSLYETGTITDFSLLEFAFGKWWIGAQLWAVMFAFSWIAYYFQIQISFGKFPARFVYFVLHPAAILGIYLFAFYGVVLNDLPPATSFMVLCEATRFAMKMHSYLFVNRFYATAQKNKTFFAEGQNEIDLYPNNINTSDFLYFHFAPTVVYSSIYPRSPDRSMLKVLWFFIEHIGCILYTYTILNRYCLPVFAETHSSLRNLVLATFQLMLPGAACLIIAFYGVLHCWMNAWGELLQFGDRQFYLDWWNTTNWGSYYRKWNCVVHNFLFRHIYLDAIYVGGFKREVSLLLTFLISAIIHEFIVGVALRVSVPILFVLFAGPGILFIFLTKKNTAPSWNVFMWVMLLMGNGMLLSLYSRAYYYSHYAGDRYAGWSGFLNWPGIEVPANVSATQ